MLRVIRHYLRSRYSRYRCGIDTADVQQLRADLRFRLALVECAYYGKSCQRVARCLRELRGLLSDKAMTQYLRALDPELRSQFVERFQGSQGNPAGEPESRREPESRSETGGVPSASGTGRAEAWPSTAFAANVVPITRAQRHTSADQEAVGDGRPPLQP